MSQQKMRTGAWANILPFTIMSALTSHWAIGHRLKFIIWKEVKKNQGKSTKPRLRNYVLTLGKNGLDKGVNLNYPLSFGHRNLWGLGHQFHTFMEYLIFPESGGSTSGLG